MPRNRRRQTRAKTIRSTDESSSAVSPSANTRRVMLTAVLIAVSWFLTAITLAGRRHLVLGYSTIVFDTPLMDPFLSSNTAFVFSLVLIIVWFIAWRAHCKATIQSGYIDASPVVLLGFASLPLVLNVARILGVLSSSASYFEVLVFVAFTGFSAARLTWGDPGQVREPGQVNSRANSSSSRFGLAGLCMLSVLAGVWWYFQSVWFYDHYMLGFNDFGHFTQRIANTAAGRGFLLESPVLPPFWDHFNPVLVVLVPLWKVFPTVHVVFVLQALCLAGSSVLVWAIARTAKASPVQSMLWALAWLVQPAIGQMNVAYTYGWHPISIAIPLLLAALWSLQTRRWWLVCTLTFSAMMVEEGVIVVVGCFCFANLLANWIQHFYRGQQRDTSKESAASVSGSERSGVHEDAMVSSNFIDSTGNVWWAFGFVLSLIVFFAVYRFSGIAEFQTGRFVALGSNAWEVLSSPVTNPSAFWGQLLMPRKLAYLLSVLLPCFLPAVLRGWRFAIACVVPFLVLLVWDHFPATCLSFQYASALLPVIWFAAIHGSQSFGDKNDECSPSNQLSGEKLVQSEHTVGTSHWSLRRSHRYPAQGAFATGLVLSLFVGQLPYSVPSMLDVYAATYGQDLYDPRSPDRPITVWLNDQVRAIQEDGREVLATSRIASHLVGNRDVETVGQYLERRPDLAMLPDRAGDPIGHYRWIILDRLETFQQTSEQTEKVFDEAQVNGFHVIAENAEIVVLRRD